MYGKEDLSLNVGNLECPTTESISSYSFRRNSGCFTTSKMKFSDPVVDFKNGVNHWEFVG